MGGAQYYAKGGFHDYLGDFSTQGEAEDKGKHLMRDERDFEWFHVVNAETMKIVSGSDAQALGADEISFEKPEIFNL